MWIETTKNGFRAVEQFTDPMTGLQRKVSCKLPNKSPAEKKKAQQKLNEKIEKKLNDSKFPETKDLRFGQLVDLYLEAKKPEWKPSSYTINKRRCDKLVDIIGKNVLVTNLSKVGFVESQIRKYNTTPSTRNGFTEKFKTVIRWGYTQGYINDISYLMRLQPVKDKRKQEKLTDKYLESWELQKLLDNLTNERYRLITKFLALSGLRFGEMAALTVKDIDFKENVIHITKTFDSANKVVSDSPKTRTSNRDVFMQPELMKVCKEIMKFTKEDSMRNGYRNDRFLSSVRGTPLSNDVYNRYVARHTPDNIKKHITAHTLRHTHCSLLAEQGVSLDAISRRLGHEDEKITRQIYLHVTQRLREKDNAQLEKVQIL